jgi:putative two-component system response regulator
MKVAVVDDNTVNIAVLRALVRHLPDCECFEFTEPARALLWCEGQEPDLVLVDYMMPAMNGLQFVAAFRALPGCQEVPVLMITASHETEIRHSALNQGVTDFLTKPVDRVEFLARSRNMLALRKSQKALSDRAVWLAEEVARATAEIANREVDTILRLSKAAEYRDPETGAHVLRMAHYSRLIGAKLGMSDTELTMLFHAAPLHDMGKVGTPDHILLKPGKLDADEMAIMREHAQIGYEILCDSRSPCLQLAAIIAKSHHEKFDGSGYPDGLKGEEIPLVGRIVAVADVFDALNSERPYKEGWPLDKARKYIEDNSGTHFDPTCVRAFLSSWLDVLEIRAKYRDDPHDAALHRPLPHYLQTKETA